MLRNRTLLAVSLAVCATYIGFGMVGPVRVLYAQAHGASLEIIGAMASSYLIANFLFQYPGGWLADRWGRKPVMIIGLALQAILSLVYLPITNPDLFVVLRFVEGMTGAAILPSARAIIVDIVPSEKQGEAYGIFGAFFNAGFLIGPGIGGILATSSYASAFIGAAICRLVAIAVVILLIPATTKAGGNRSSTMRSTSLRALFTLPLVGAYFLVFGDYLYLGFDQTLMPIWMHNNLGATVAIIGFAYMVWAVPNVILSPIGGRIADRRRRSLLILTFGLAQVPIYIIYGLTSQLIVVIVLFAIHGTVYAFIQPAVDSHVASSSAVDMRARVQGMYSTFGLIGAFFGANVLTPLYSINYHLPLLGTGILYGVCVLIGGIMIFFSEKRSKEQRGLIPESQTPESQTPTRDVTTFTGL
jgi:MFS family permease